MPDDLKRVDEVFDEFLRAADAPDPASPSLQALEVEAVLRGSWSRVAAWLAGGKRFAHLVPQLAAHLGLPLSRAEALVEDIDSDAKWEESGDGVDVMPLTSEQALVRIQPGAQFAASRGGAVLVLEGGVSDASAVELWRGGSVTLPTVQVRALAGPACVLAVVWSAP
jgi:hypothetical protein